MDKSMISKNRLRQVRKLTWSHSACVFLGMLLNFSVPQESYPWDSLCKIEDNSLL